jgi:hypothetical protein
MTVNHVGSVVILYANYLVQIEAFKGQQALFLSGGDITESLHLLSAFFSLLPLVISFTVYVYICTFMFPCVYARYVRIRIYVVIYVYCYVFMIVTNNRGIGLDDWVYC